MRVSDRSGQLLADLRGKSITSILAMLDIGVTCLKSNLIKAEVTVTDVVIIF